jgi:cytoskeleton protein RodZ
LVSFGTRLKKEREQRGVALEDVSLSTKIGTRMLRALEEEKFEQLPGGIFNKGFVRAYARYLGIDEEQAVADYLEAAGETPPAALQAAALTPKAESKRDSGASAPVPPLKEKKQSGFPLGMVAALLLVAALGLWTWKRYSEPETSPSADSTTAQSQPTTPPASSPPDASASQPVASGSSIQAPNPATSNSPHAEQKPASESQNPDSNAKLVIPAKPSSPSENTGPTGSFSVRIQVDSDSWVSIKADGKTLYEGTMAAPAQRTVHAQKQIVLRSGNVGGLSLSFNGKPLSSQGGQGEVKTLMFGPEGLEVASSAGEEKPPQ